MGDEPAKAQRSRDLLAEGGVISVQVLNEFASVCGGKRQVDWTTLHALLEDFRGQLQVEL